MSESKHNALEGVTAAVLAGGLGTRLRPAVADRPKVLAPICGRPFLAFLLDRLAEAGLRQAVLCTGYLGDQIRAAFGESHAGLRLAYSQEPAPLGTGGGLRLAAPLLRSDTVLVMNGDSYCDVDLAGFWAWHRERKTAASLVVVEALDTQRFGRVRVEADGRVKSFEEKGGGPGAGWINAGVYLVGRRLIETIPAAGVVSLERDLFPRWIGKGLCGYRTRARFLDIGTPESYAAARQFFAPAVEAP